MSEGMLIIVSMLLGPIALVLVEFTKILAVFGWDKVLTSAGKLKAALIISAVVAIVAALVTGTVNVPQLISDVMALFQNPPGFWECIPAFAAVFKDLAAMIGIVVAASQAAYALLKKKLKDIGWLAT